MESITAKIARLAPRQIAMVASTVTVKAGALRSWRRAKRRLFMKESSFGAQGCDGIGLGGAERGRQRRKQRDERENKNHSAKNHRIVSGCPEQQRLHETRHGGGEEPGDQTDCRESRALSASSRSACAEAGD